MKENNYGILKFKTPNPDDISYDFDLRYKTQISDDEFEVVLSGYGDELELCAWYHGLELLDAPSVMEPGDQIRQTLRAKLNPSVLSCGIGERIPLKSTGGTKLGRISPMYTAEVNGHLYVVHKNGYVAQATQLVTNVSHRVPSCLAEDRHGETHAVHFWAGRWVGAYHRVVQFSREWEPLNPEISLSQEEANKIDTALNKV